MIIKLEYLAKDIEKKLEEISYDIAVMDGEDTHILFNITDNLQIYNNNFLKKEGRSFTPGILRKIPSGISTSTTQWGVETVMLQLEIYGYRSERYKIKEIFRQFIADYNAKPYIPEAGYQVFSEDKVGVLALSDFMIEEFTSTDDGTDTSRFVGYMDLAISIFVGGLSAKDTGLKIDDIDIPFDEIQYKQDKSVLPNLEYKDSTMVPLLQSKLIAESISFNVPFRVSNEADQLIFSRALMPSYNDVFELKWDLGIGVKVGSYALRSAFIQYNQQNEAIGVQLSFGTVTENATVMIDGITVPVLKFAFNSTRDTEPFVVEDEDTLEARFLPSTYSFGIGMNLFLDKTNEVVMKLYDEVTTNTNEVSHTITFDQGEDTYEFEVILIDGEWGFEENVDEVLSVTFIGEKLIR